VIVQYVDLCDMNFVILKGLKIYVSGNNTNSHVEVKLWRNFAICRKYFSAILYSQRQCYLTFVKFVSNSKNPHTCRVNKSKLIQAYRLGPSPDMELTLVEFEFFTAVTLNSTVLWVETCCHS
jgi:hypothetical protein